MTLGLVHANYSLPECQAVKLTDFASWKGMFFSVELAGICGEGQRNLLVTPSKWLLTVVSLSLLCSIRPGEITAHYHLFTLAFIYLQIHRTTN